MSTAELLQCDPCLGTGYAHTQDPRSGEWTRREWACHECRGTGLVDCSICNRPKADRYVGEAPVCRECVATADTIPAPPPDGDDVFACDDVRAAQLTAALAAVGGVS